MTENICPICKKPFKINLIYHFEAHTIYWIGGRGYIKNVEMLCLGCGESFTLDGKFLIWSLEFLKEISRKNNEKIPNVDGLISETKNEIDEKEREELEKKIMDFKCEEREKRIKKAKTFKEKIMARISPISIEVEENIKNNEEYKGFFWNCEYCNKEFDAKKECDEHEKNCKNVMKKKKSA